MICCVNTVERMEDRKIHMHITHTGKPNLQGEEGCWWVVGGVVGSIYPEKLRWELEPELAKDMIGCNIYYFSSI